MSAGIIEYMADPERINRDVSCALQSFLGLIGGLTQSYFYHSLKDTAGLAIVPNELSNQWYGLYC